ncbi:bifunctional DNA primase/polymerase [Ornithinimicrobium sp. LYQ92]|uniref:bifunctional DNA primase/polymerase n=1 Tax=Serinicoccus sp. LYQ92 TaxID=3378798 RepID=UPI003851EA8C
MTAATNDSPWDHPYGFMAPYYVNAGWLGALPLPPGRKEPVPAGFTGYNGLDPVRRDIEKWIAGSPSSNVALRLPRNVLGIDVDAYEGKSGGHSLEVAESRFGPLPPTWRTTARYPEDTVSGIRLFQVPEGLKWPNTIGPGIETIHHGHRYAVAPPSIHPSTGKHYLWVDPQGKAGLDYPRPGSLPWLPQAWVAGLTDGEMATGATARVEPPPDAQGWLTPGEPCRAVLGQLERLTSALSVQGSRHDATRDLMLSVLYLGQQGHEGVGSALKSMHDDYVRAVGKDRDGDVEIEWTRMLHGAFEIVAASPREPEPCRGDDCGKPTKLETPAALAGPEMVVDPSATKQTHDASVEEAEDSLFWDRRPELRHIKDFARSRMASPWATLGVVLARVVCGVGPEVVVPPIVGKSASLNLYIGVVGASGSGKQAAEGAAEEAFAWRFSLDVLPLGSGEGMAQSFVEVKKEKGQPSRLVTVRQRALFRASEVDNLGAQAGRKGSTLMPSIRDAWMGDQLGFAYKSDNRLIVEPHAYRLGLIVGIQPERATALLSKEERDGGTPQRFLWLPARDALIPDEPPAEPPPPPWSPPGTAKLVEDRGRRLLPVPEQVAKIIRQAAVDRHRGKTEALDGHALLAHLKVSAALAFLAGRAAVGMEDWDLAGVVMAKSNATRRSVELELESSRSQSNRGRALSEAERDETKEEYKEDKALKRVSANLLRRLDDLFKGEWTNATTLIQKIAYRDRERWFQEGIDALMAAGAVETREHEGVVQYRSSK